MEFIPKYIKRVEDRRSSEKIKNVDWNELFNLLISQGDHNTEALVNLVSELGTHSSTEEVQQMINNKILEIGSADMTKAEYDTNHDGIVNLADSVVDNSIKTNHIVDGNITINKLEDALQHKIDYMYTNVSRLLIFMGGQAEIEGTANLVLFGLDGSLQVPYNAATENTSVKMYSKNLSSGWNTLTHEDQNITSKINTSTEYTITNNTRTHRTKISSITNASLIASDTTVAYQAYKGDRQDRIKIVHIEDDYYCIACSAYPKGTDNDYSTIFLVKYNSTNDSLTIISSANNSGYVEDIVKMGKYVLVHLYEDGWESCYSVTKSAITDMGEFVKDRSGDEAYSSYGAIYFVGYDVNDKYERAIYKISGVGPNGTTKIRTMTTNGYISMYQINGRWAAIDVENRSTEEHEYFWFDMSNDSFITTASLPTQIGGIPDPDGTHFYYNGAKYSCDSNRGITKVTDGSGLPASFSMLNVGVIRSGLNVYAIEGNTCRLVYSLAPFDKQIQYSADLYYPIADFAVNADMTQGIMGLRIDWDHPQLARCFKYTRGTVTLATPAINNILGDISIKRQQDCTIPSGQTKNIYIKPDTKSNSFKSIDLIVYLNRPLSTGDSLTVEVRAGSEVSVLTPTSASADTTKYYEKTFTTASADIEVIITATAGSTGTLQLTQVLGGVDNEV